MCTCTLIKVVSNYDLSAIYISDGFPKQSLFRGWGEVYPVLFCMFGMFLILQLNFPDLAVGHPDTRDRPHHWLLARAGEARPRLLRQHRQEQHRQQIYVTVLHAVDTHERGTSRAVRLRVHHALRVKGRFHDVGIVTLGV